MGKHGEVVEVRKEWPEVLGVIEESNAALQR